MMRVDNRLFGYCLSVIRGMRRIIRIFFSVGAVLTLIGYFFGDLVLSEAPETLSWSEFSSNTGAVARFQEQHELAGGGGNLRQAYEQQVARIRSAQGLSASRHEVGAEVAAWKLAWRGVYGQLTPRRWPMARGSFRVGNGWSIPSETVGVVLVLTVLVGIVIGATALISKLEFRAQKAHR